MLVQLAHVRYEELHSFPLLMQVFSLSVIYRHLVQANVVCPTPSLHHPLLEPVTKWPLYPRELAYLSLRLIHFPVQAFAPSLVLCQMWPTEYRWLQCWVVWRVQLSPETSPLCQMVSNGSYIGIRAPLQMKFIQPNCCTACLSWHSPKFLV